LSRFLSIKYADLEPYVPGEQPQDQPYIKLNTNENAFPPHPSLSDAVAAEAGKLQLYSDPESRALRQTLADYHQVSPEELIMSNGSDEVLNFAFMAFCDAHTPAVFPDVTYGFYPVFARINQVPFRELPLREDWAVEPRDYFHAAGTIFLANPNAPTGIALTRAQVEEILQMNPYNVVVVDEAYVNFGAKSCVPLIREYDNLLVTRTFSKYASLAGGRLGYGAACPELIADLNAMRNSINPYNVNRMTAAAGISCLKDDAYYQRNCRQIQNIRSWTAGALKELGFTLTDSLGNFLFVRHPRIGGEELYVELKKRGILIRHFRQERIQDYNRISIGTRAQMEKLVNTLKKLLEERA